MIAPNKFPNATLPPSVRDKFATYVSWGMSRPSDIQVLGQVTSIHIKSHYRLATRLVHKHLDLKTASSPCNAWHYRVASLTLMPSVVLAVATHAPLYLCDQGFMLE